VLSSELSEFGSLLWYPNSSVVSKVLERVKVCSARHSLNEFDNARII
jgi:hypothetical protein